MTACSDNADTPTAPLRHSPSGPDRLLSSSTYPSESDWAASGGGTPTVTAQTPTGAWSADGKTWFVSGTISFLNVNSVTANLTVTISNTNTGSPVAIGRAAPYTLSGYQPALTRRTVTLRATATAPTNCDIRGSAVSTVNGSLTLLNNSLMTVTAYAMPSTSEAVDDSHPACKQTKSDSAYVEPACPGQTMYRPGNCTTGTGSSPAAGTGGGSHCEWWVRRLLLSYDGGRTWHVVSEEFFQRC